MSGEELVKSRAALFTRHSRFPRMLYGMLSTLSRSETHTEQSALPGGATAAVTVTVTGGGRATRAIAYYVAMNVIGLLFLKRPLDAAAAAAARHVQTDFPAASGAVVSIFVALLDPARDEFRYLQFGPEYARAARLRLVDKVERWPLGA